MNDKVSFTKLTKDINTNLNYIYYIDLGIIQYQLDKAEPVEHCNMIEYVPTPLLFLYITIFAQWSIK